MRKGESERRKAMKEGFMELRNQNYTIAEIAEKYQLSTWSVYQSLGEIATVNGVTRDSLLYVVKRQDRESKEGSSRKLETIDTKEIKQDFEELLKQVDSVIEKIDSAVLHFEEDN